MRYWLELFFKHRKTSSNPRFAYEETTKEWRGAALHYRPLPTLAHVPYVCLRIPTGGGKTLIGGLAIERANRSLLFTQHSVTLWLTPKDLSGEHPRPATVNTLVLICHHMQ